MRHRWWLTAAAIPLVASALGAFGPVAQASGARHAAPAATSTGPGIGGGRTGLAAGDPFCKRLGKLYQASSAAQMFCFGSAKPAGVQPRVVRPTIGASGNVDAANPREDVSTVGVRGYGQSEESIAAAGPYVVEAWNDSTTFFSTCGSKKFKEEGTGIGFSVNGGKTFTDLGGLRNPGCNTRLYAGDPSVVAYVAGGHTFFYVFSLYLPANFFGQTHIAFDPCEVIGSGASADLHCGRPVVAASSTQCFRGRHHFSFCSFLDKDFATVDPARGRLYVSYSDFPIIGRGDPIDLAVCDIGTRAGEPGPAGGTPAHPVCKHGTPLVKTTRFHGHLFVGQPYLKIAPRSRLGCENEGSYPAVNVRTGAVYVGYEFNWATNLFDPACFGAKTRTRDVLTATPFHCLKLHAVAACARPAKRNHVNVVSLESAFFPGYNRFPASDFPRLAVSSRFGAVSMVWNDSRFHANGDVLMASFKLGSLARVQKTPTVLDRPHGGGMTFLPALRVANANGLLDVAWYSRASGVTSATSVKGAVDVNPLATSTPANVTITNRTNNWLQNNSDIVPNFGDYIDAVVSATGSWPFVGGRFWVAWADARSGVPQPFSAHIRAG